jgi:hypothetical protein
MIVARLWVVLLGIALAGMASAQAWMSAYESGLKAARALQWMEARQHFQQAAAYRPEDVATPTTLPGPVTEQRRWRGGAPYSPNFLAAYSAYRAALESPDQTRREQLLRTAAEEFEALMARGQASPETFFFLNEGYLLLGQEQQRQQLATRFANMRGRIVWRVDTEVVAPDELARIDTGVRTQPAATDNVIRAEDLARPGAGTTTPLVRAGDRALETPATVFGRVQPLTNKYALIIGNAEGQLREGSVPFAADDAMRVREALVAFGGYMEHNIDVVVNASAAEIMAAARALAERVPERGTVFLYFSGVGSNLDGRDFLAGVDASSITDSSAMVAKSDLYRLFMQRGASIFAFFQAARPLVGGRYFGMEVPLVGSLAQVQATLPGEGVFSTVKGGRQVGLFTDALTMVMAEFRSNQIPIQEFGWQLFYRLRRGDAGTTGGGARQTPTLPVLTHMGTDARF